MFNLKIHNFRSFQNQSFNFSRINILIGENSGGKSSLLKFLLSLKQTLDSPTEVNLKLKGDFTDLGNYEEAVYQKNKNRKMKIAFSNKDGYFDFFLNLLKAVEKNQDENTLKSIIKIIEGYDNSRTEINFDINSKLNNHSSLKTVISNEKVGKLFIIQKKPTSEEGFRELYCDLKFEFKNRSGVIENCIAFKEGFLTLIGQELKSSCKELFDDDYEYVYYSLVYLLLYQNFIIEQIEKIRFVNPIGNSPKRLYFQEDKKASYKLIDIEKFINVIGDPLLTKKEYNERIELLNDIIKEFGIAEEIKLVKDEQLPILALNVKTKNFWSNITDVGYGVSLQIPILFQAMLSENYTRKGQTILIEQPEVHLHPTLQAKFIDTLLSIGEKNTYFIETHSEHIVRKLQVLIKNKSYNLKPEDITIHYFKRSAIKFDISEHKILQDGILSPSFPTGFFDTSYSLVKDLL
jgi:predicted ATPase